MLQDAETAEALKPYYQQFCKRPCFHDDYLDTFVSAATVRHHGMAVV